MTRRILVLGGNGFIGRQVVTALAQCSWATPIAASRRAPSSSIADRVERIRVDATDRDALRAAMDGIHGVVNCIAGDSTAIVESARALFEEAAGRGPALRVVHLSSTAVYGPATGLLDETAALSDASSPYVRAKVAAEKLSSAVSSTVILRPGIVYGRGSTQWTDRVARWLQARRIGDLGPRGDGYCNLVYIDDLVAAILQSHQLRAGAHSPPVRRITRRRLMIESKLLAPPLKAAELLCARLGIAGRAAPPAMPSSLLYLFRQELRLDVTRAGRLLAQRWTPIDQGLRQASAWVHACQASPAVVR